MDLLINLLLFFKVICVLTNFYFIFQFAYCQEFMLYMFELFFVTSKINTVVPRQSTN
jgi:hypothetical protein